MLIDTRIVGEKGLMEKVFTEKDINSLEFSERFEFVPSVASSKEKSGRRSLAI